MTTPAGGTREEGGTATWRRVGTVALVLVVLAGGCLGDGGSVGTTATTTEDATGTTGTHDELRATVDRVIDGDTVVVTFENGTEETVRLLGVDTPETSTKNTPGEYEGVPDTAAGRDCLDTWGDLAHAVAIEALSGEEVRVVFDERSDRRGYYGRLLAYVYVDGESFNHRLVEEGYARVYESDFTELEAYLAAEERAMTEGRGLWECRTPGDATTTTADSDQVGETGLVVATTHFDAQGNDNENLNDEYVTFRNDGESHLDLSGWTVEDEAGHAYTFPESTVLDPGETLTLYTGDGTDAPGERYWGAGGAIWNNGGDTVIVRNGSGTVVLRHSATPWMPGAARRVVVAT